MLSPNQILRLLLPLGLLACAACGGETAEEAPPPEREGTPATISFEAVAYLDPAASNARIIERIRHETESVVAALRKQQIEISRKRQVDVDLRRVMRERVTVVDPASGARRPALRVRYWFVGFTTAPPEALQKGEIPFGLLHRDDDPRAPALAPCLGDGASDKPPSQRFDPSLDGCRQAIDAEQRAIDAARASAHTAPGEILPIEQGRLTLPISLYLKPRAARAKVDLDAGADGAATQGEHPGDVRVKTPGGIDTPGSGEEREPGVVTLAEKLRERERAEAEAEDDEPDEGHKVRRPTFVLAGDKSKPDELSGHAGVINEPSYALLWILGLVVVGVAANEFRRKRSKRRR